MSDLVAILSVILRQDISRTHNLMLRKIMSDLGTILSEILSKIFQELCECFMLRKIMSDLGAILSEIHRQDHPKTQFHAKKYHV